MVAGRVENPMLGRTLHKVTLYLILVNLGLVAGFGLRMSVLGFCAFMLTGALLVSYQLVITRLMYLEARRSNDGYLIYPVILAGLGLALLLLLSVIGD
ncbi:hypothetical protein CGX12_11750 [Zobellella denitrificans]|uniref:hypothetical protein n=1 Tax=Zobellella denitrificans TaxID=347534 RepID=UPI000B8BE0E4|nr:hypothetical protein [Zobellella denitrificans]OXS14950.1 hypothetical protein CGX12_11750 [Zobellella denitrificans]